MLILSKILRKRLIPVAILLLFVISSCARVQTDEEKEVIAVVQKAFDALAAKDSAAARVSLLPEGQYFSIREEGMEVVIDGASHEEFFHRIASLKDDVLERMFEPKVLIHGRIAVVWTAYDFFRNRDFDHGGVEAFTLLKTTAGWKIAGTIFTVEHTDANESPWGPNPFQDDR
ncbi:MAG: hypothetical protein JSV17_07980 [Candidatus Aminicenantes bacterium]|nr:MAG: hypothetical protein JSV17_07980 [Candidatus Aminicenantes bacterium]